MLICAVVSSVVHITGYVFYTSRIEGRNTVSA